MKIKLGIKTKIALLVVFLGSSGMAQKNCEIVDAFSKQSLVCGSRETELFVKPTEKVQAVVLLLKDKEQGRERQISVTSLNLKVSDLSSGGYLKNKAIEKQLSKVSKEWGKAPDVELQKVELGSSSHYYTAQDFSREIKPQWSMDSKRSVASSQKSEARFSGIMRAQAKRGSK